ncbi:discoidin domain-containing protein [Streptomyces sp. S1]|uniref:discoidin domain-containing protein n=1 Tax=Streptomyces sp. S1 TaxID=718288 RepID=UPI003D72ACA9
MAITQVGTATTAKSAGGTTVAVTKPSGVASGDILVAFAVTNKSEFDTLPSGFTEIGRTNDADVTNSFRTTGWYKICGGSEPSSYSFGASGAQSVGAPIVVILTAWRGATNIGNPISHISIDEVTGNSAEPTNSATSFTQTNNGRLFFVRASRSTTAIPSYTNGTGGWSELADDGEFSGGSTRYGIAFFASDADTGSGARTEPAITCSTTETENGYILGCIEAALVPDAGTASISTTANAPVPAVKTTAPTIGTKTDLLFVPSAVTSSAENGPNETDEMLADGNLGTKWLAFATTAWIRYQLPSPGVVTRYVMTSANDVDTRDPNDWELQGSNNGSVWDTLDTRTDEVFASRGLSKSYDVSNSTPYLYYRLNITQNNGNVTATQLADWLIYG